MITQTDDVFDKQNGGKISDSFVDFALTCYGKNLPVLQKIPVVHSSTSPKIVKNEKTKALANAVELARQKTKIMIGDWLSNIRLYEMSRNIQSHDDIVDEQEFKNALNVGLFSENSVLKTINCVFGDTIDKLKQEKAPKQTLKLTK